MAAAVLTRLERILDLEEKQGWRNRGVIGGLQAMAERWGNDARAEGLPPRQIATLTELMSAYGGAAQSERADVAAAIRRAAAADFTATEVEALSAENLTAEAVIDEPLPDDLPPLTIPEGSFEEIVAATPAEAPVRPVNTAPPAPGLGTVYTSEDDEEFVIPPPEPTHKAQARVARQQQKARRNPADLDAKVTTISGVGASTAEQLARLDIFQVIDLLWHLPFRHDDYSQMRTISQLQPG